MSEVTGIGWIYKRAEGIKRHRQVVLKKRQELHDVVYDKDEYLK